MKTVGVDLAAERRERPSHRLFVEFISRHQDGHVVIPPGVAGRDWRRNLANRTTDAAVRQLTELVPLSVAADRIGHNAMRCAGLLAYLALDGRTVDRAGTGTVVEVYPAASLKQWNLPYRKDKGKDNAAPLGELIDKLLAAATWLSLGGFEDQCRRSDDAIADDRGARQHRGLHRVEKEASPVPPARPGRP